MEPVTLAQLEALERELRVNDPLRVPLAGLIRACHFCDLSVIPLGPESPVVKIIKKDVMNGCQPV